MKHWGRHEWIRNRHNRLDDCCDVYVLFFSGTTGVEQSQWCTENCEGLWNFSDYYSNGMDGYRQICEFHFELKSDAENFKIYWKLADLRFCPQSEVSDNNFSYRNKYRLNVMPGEIRSIEPVNEVRYKAWYL